MAKIIVKRLKEKTGTQAWSNHFTTTVEWAPNEVLSDAFLLPHMGWVDNIKTLKNGTRKYKSTNSTKGNDFAKHGKNVVQLSGCVVDVVVFEGQ